MRRSLIPLVADFLFVSISPANSQTADARPEDVASPEAVVLAAYAALARAPGDNFDWVRFRSLFLPEAQMIPSTEQRGGSFDVLTVEGFIDWIDTVYEENDLIGGPDDTGFEEEQIAVTVQRFGDVAQAFSTYQKHFWESDEILGRGINSFNLVHNEDRWWIASIAWDEEVGAGPIPDMYLPAGE
jgi:hypothetical protein